MVGGTELLLASMPRRETENGAGVKGPAPADAWLRRNAAALTDGLSRGWQGRHFRRIRLRRWNLRCGRGRIHYRAQRGITAGKEINRIRPKEYNCGHGKQREDIKQASQHHTSVHHSP